MHSKVTCLLHTWHLTTAASSPSHYCRFQSQLLESLFNCKCLSCIKRNAKLRPSPIMHGDALHSIAIYQPAVSHRFFCLSSCGLITIYAFDQVCYYRRLAIVDGIYRQCGKLMTSRICAHPIDCLIYFCGQLSANSSPGNFFPAREESTHGDLLLTLKFLAVQCSQNLEHGQKYVRFIGWILQRAEKKKSLFMSGGALFTGAENTTIYRASAKNLMYFTSLQWVYSPKVWWK